MDGSNLPQDKILALQGPCVYVTLAYSVLIALTTRIRSPLRGFP
jgi:hypothetical protein